MSVVILGGNECMERRYKDLCQSYKCSAKVFTKPSGGLKNKLGSPDLMIFFTSTMSHKLVQSALSELKGTPTRIERCHTSSLSALRSILEGLGYTVAARYEKVREPWRMDTVEVELDALPFAQVVELEGRAQDIARVEKRLNLDNAEISIKSYHELHQEWLRQNNKPKQLSFVFDEAQRAHWRTVLGLTEKADVDADSSRQS